MSDIQNKYKATLALNLGFVKNYLRVDHNEDDALLKMYIVAAEEYAQRVIGSDFIIDGSIRSAMLIHISCLYNNLLAKSDFEIVDKTYISYKNYNIQDKKNRNH